MTRRARLCPAAAAFALAAALASPSARSMPQSGGGPANPTLATELFDAGRELMASGRTAEACPKLAESARLDPRVGTLGNLADCEEKMGRLARARSAWQQAANLARSTGDQRAQHAASQVSRLDARTPKLRVMAPAAIPAGMVVLVDAAEVGAGSLGMAIPLDPGAHSIEAKAPGRAAWKADVQLVARGETVDVQIPDLPVEASASEGAAGAEPGAVMVETGPGPIGILGLVATGLGVVGLGVGTYFAGVAQSRTDLSNELGCEGDRCGAHAAEVRTSAREAGNVATAAFVAGGALAVGGLVTFLLAPERVEAVPVVGGAPRVSAMALPPIGDRGASASASIRGGF